MKNIINKPWGHECIIHQNDMVVVKYIYVKPGHRLSLQYHEEKNETLFILPDSDGYVDTNDIQSKVDYSIEVDGKEILMERRTLNPNSLFALEPIYVPAGVIHRMGTSDERPGMFYEVSTTQLKDVVRLADDYGR